MEGKRVITIAMSRGRLLDDAVALFKKSGVDIEEISKDSRKLIFNFEEYGLKVLIIRPTDVPAYVEYGAADCGIVGKDTLMENKNNLYEPLDLKVGRCRLVVAGPKDFEITPAKILRVATKYPRISSSYFVKKGISVEIVKLYGSLELAPIAGLSDVIVDLSATGETLKKNNLREMESIAEITARVVVNKVSMKVKSAEIAGLIEKLKKARDASGLT